MKEKKLPPTNQLVYIKAEDLPDFVKRFNENLPSQAFMDSCKKASELFKIPK